MEDFHIFLLPLLLSDRSQEKTEFLIFRIRVDT